MYTLTLMFENEAAKEAVATSLTSGYSVPELGTNLTPNHTERTGDSIFFTRQESAKSGEGEEGKSVGATNIAIGGDTDTMEGAVPAGTGNFEPVPAGSTVVDSSAIGDAGDAITGHDKAPEDGSPDGGYTNVELTGHAGEDGDETLADAYNKEGGSEVTPRADAGETAATGVAPEDMPSRPSVSDQFDGEGRHRQTTREHLEDVREALDREISEIDESDEDEENV